MNKIGKLAFQDLYATRQIVQNVYIHLPFCQKKCYFCAFSVYAVGSQHSKENNEIKEKYLNHLLQQINFSQTITRIAKPMKSLYFGGGTPSLYSSDQLQKLCSLFPIKQAEVTLQLNPSELGSLQSYEKIGINRFSIGIQSFDSKLLTKMNRICPISRQQLENFLSTSRPNNLSLDFILDFCTEKVYFQEMMTCIQRVSPQHLTLYMLEINKGSYLEQNLHQFEWLPPQNKVIDRYIEACDKLKKMGYIQYQISNFAKAEKYFSKHNQCYWAGSREYLAFGMGAASLSKGIRVTRPRNVSKYLKFVNLLRTHEKIPVDQLKIDVSDETSMLKQLQSILMSGLRSCSGVSWKIIEKFCSSQFATIKSTILSALREIELHHKGLIQFSSIEQAIILTSPEGLLLADEITFRIITALQKNNFSS